MRYTPVNRPPLPSSKGFAVRYRDDVDKVAIAPPLSEPSPIAQTSIPAAVASAPIASALPETAAQESFDEPQYSSLTEAIMAKRNKTSGSADLDDAVSNTPEDLGGLDLEGLAEETEQDQSTLSVVERIRARLRAKY